MKLQSYILIKTTAAVALLLIDFCAARINNPKRFCLHQKHGATLSEAEASSVLDPEQLRDVMDTMYVAKEGGTVEAHSGVDTESQALGDVQRQWQPDCRTKHAVCIT